MGPFALATSTHRRDRTGFWLVRQTRRPDRTGTFPGKRDCVREVHIPRIAFARAMPESWHWPERIARKAVGEPTILEAGIRLIRSQNPVAWEELMGAQRILTENRETLDRCIEKARKVDRSISCEIQIEP